MVGKGKHLSDAHKQKLREKMRGCGLGKHLSEATKRKISESNKGQIPWIKGRHHSEESKQKIKESHLGEKNPMFGKHFSEEASKKMSESLSGEKNPKFGKPSSMLGKHHTEETLQKMSGENHSAWKGDEVGYMALHSWVRRHKPKVELCEGCNKKKKLVIANISGEYKRDINDFKWLCQKCHMKMDNDNKKEKLLQTNCSEVIAKLDVASFSDARDILEEIGMKVIKYDPYLSLYHGGRFSEKYWMVIDPKNPNSPDFQHTAKLSLTRANYDESDKEAIWIDGHQHSQHQLYPTIKRISDALGLQFDGYDGGGSFNEIYDEWIKKGAVPLEDFQTDIRNEIKILLRDPIVIKTIKSFKAVEIAVKKKVVQQDKYALLIEAIKKSMLNRKTELIEKQREKEIKNHEEWEKRLNEEHPDRKPEPLKMPSDKELFTYIERHCDFAINGTLYLMVTNKKLAQVFLQNDQKILDELGKMLSK